MPSAYILDWESLALASKNWNWESASELSVPAEDAPGGGGLGGGGPWGGGPVGRGLLGSGPWGSEPVGPIGDGSDG